MDNIASTNKDTSREEKDAASVKRKLEDVDPLKEPGVVFPKDKRLGGIGFKENDDGTRTYFPKTYINFYSQFNAKALGVHLSKEESDLITSALKDKGDHYIKEVINSHNKRWPNQPKLTDEQAQAAALMNFYRDTSTDEFLFVANRSLESTEIVGVLRLDMNTKHKNVCEAESYPARVRINVQATIDLCRGKSPLTLRQMLAKAHDFFTKAASFQIAMDRAKHERKSSWVSCRYELILRMVDIAEEKDSSKSSSGRSGCWIYPTKSMLEEWGYKPKGIKYYGQPVDETKLIICEING